VKKKILVKMIAKNNVFSGWHNEVLNQEYDNDEELLKANLSHLEAGRL
jgi:hypothetical protein